MSCVFKLNKNVFDVINMYSTLLKCIWRYNNLFDVIKMHSKFELSAFECSTFYTVEPSSAKEREREWDFWERDWWGDQESWQEENANCPKRRIEAKCDRGKAREWKAMLELTSIDLKLHGSEINTEGAFWK